MRTMKQIMMAGSALLIAGTSFAFNASALDDVNVMTGGVGASSQTYMETAQKDHTLKLVFTGDRGMYLSDVKVAIVNSKGETVVSSVTDGPMLLATLAPGRYTVKAEAEGFTKNQTIQVGQNVKTFQIGFPEIKDDSNYSSNVETKW